MRLEVVLLILGMGVVTFLPRFLPLALMSRFSLSARLKNSLGYVPVAIISAILFPLLFSSSSSSFVLDAQVLLAALLVVGFFYFSKNLWLGVLAGMLAYWLLGVL